MRPARVTRPPVNRFRVNVRILDNAADQTCRRGSILPRRTSTSPGGGGNHRHGITLAETDRSFGPLERPVTVSYGHNEAARARCWSPSAGSCSRSRTGAAGSTSIRRWPDGDTAAASPSGNAGGAARTAREELHATAERAQRIGPNSPASDPSWKPRWRTWRPTGIRIASSVSPLVAGYGGPAGPAARRPAG